MNIESSWQCMQLEWPLPNHFFFNIRNYSCEVRNIQRRKADLNINLPRVNNFRNYSCELRNIQWRKEWIISILKKKWFGSGHSSCVHCQLDLNIHMSNDYSCKNFLSADMNGVVDMEQLVTLLYSLHCSWVSHFKRILLATCCLQLVAVARTWSKNFSAASSPIFTWGHSKQVSVKKT